MSGENKCLSSSVVVRMEGENMSNLGVNQTLMDRFATTLSIQYLVMPTLSRADRGHTMRLKSV